jgi:hypothetical protein
MQSIGVTEQKKRKKNTKRSGTTQRRFKFKKAVNN